MTAGVLYLYHLADPDLKPLLPVLLPVPFAEGTIVVPYGAAGRAHQGNGRARAGRAHPAVPIDVIIPAYNEEEMIVETLQAVDAAAGRHGGVVNVVLCNDGSTDRTAELVLEAMSRFRHARGRLIEGRHGGKSATLNAALAETTSEIVVRIDADTLVDEWALALHAPLVRGPPDRTGGGLDVAPLAPFGVRPGPALRGAAPVRHEPPDH